MGVDRPDRTYLPVSNGNKTLWKSMISLFTGSHTWALIDFQTTNPHETAGTTLPKTNGG